MKKLKVLPVNALIEPIQTNTAEIIAAISDRFRTELSLSTIIASQSDRWEGLIKPATLPSIKLPDFSIFQRDLQEHIKQALARFENHLVEISPHIKESLLLLGQNGWYFDNNMDMSSLWELKEALSDGNVQNVEDALAEYFERRLEEIERFISEKFPHRTALIVSAFKAHRIQEYNLSIPVFLAQTDGICKETVDKYLFTKPKGEKRPETAKYVEEIVNVYKAALLSPLAESLPINISKSDRPADFNALNRHAVLHGESLDYGTRINSLKAVSLLNYVTQMLAD